MALLKIKIKGSTLIETLIAIIVTVIITGMAMTFFVQVYKSDNRHLQLVTFLKLKELMIETQKEQRYFDEKYSFDSFTINKTVTSYQNIPDVLEISLVAFNASGKKIEEIKQIVYAPN
jgi:hypothetical protein